MAAAIGFYAAIISTTAVPPGPLKWWVCFMAVSVALQLAALLVPAAARRLDSRGIPMLSTPAFTMIGVGWGAVLWIDLDASRASDVRWITFAALFAMSAGVVAGGVSFLSGMVFVPMWVGTIGAFVALGQPVAAVAGATFAVICLRDMRRFGQMWIELITLRVESHDVADAYVWAATHDSMTSLVNRAGFTHALAERAQLSDVEISVMFIDLDRFKEVNDNLGHAAGDQVLIETANRIKASLRATDLVGRFGGDEFCVLLDCQHDNESVDRLAHQIIETLEMPFTGGWGSERVEISASVGVASISAHDATPERLLLDADFAMYEAKRQGRRRVVHFNSDLEADLSDRLGLKSDFRRLIRDGSLGADGQPIFNLTTGSIRCVELLARWRLPGGGNVPPSVFMPLAEELGLSGEVAKLMLQKAGEQLRAWADHRELGAARVSVNVSASDLASGLVVAMVADVITEFGIESGRLVIELTETIDFAGTASDLAQLAALRELGVGIAIDDFGTGYSSLDNLLSFPVQVVKLDATLIAKLGADPRQVAALRSIYDLAAVIGRKVVVEGVETLEQLERLQQLGTDLVQGYYLCRPVPINQLADHVDRLRADPNGPLYPVGGPLSAGRGLGEQLR